MMNVKTILIIPPLILPYSPPLGVPQLYAFLKKRKCNVNYYDLNIKYFDYIYSKSGIEFIAYIMDRILKRKEKPSPALLASSNLLKQSSAKIGLLAETAKKIYRSSAFFNVQLYKKASEIFAFLNDTMSILFPDSFILSLPSPYPQRPVSELLSDIKEETKNPYLRFMEKEADLLLARKVRLLGISICNYSQAQSAFTLARSIKKKDKDVFIVIGGSWVTDEIRDLKKIRRIFKFVDAIIPFEGEMSALKLINNLGTRSFQAVPNLIYKKGGKIVENKIERPINPIDVFPVFNKRELNKYLAPRAVIPIQASEGCKWSKCVFCNMYRCYGKYREKSLNHILKEIEYQKKRYKTIFFQFTDLSMDSKLVKNISRGINQRKLHVFWLTMTRIDPGFTPKHCKSIYESGGRVLGFGVESFSDRLLKLMNKGFDVATWTRVIGNCYKAGINSIIYFIVGFPTEKAKECLLTINKIKKLKRIIYSAVVTVFGKAPGSIYYEYSEHNKSHKFKSGMTNSEVKAIQNNFYGRDYREIFGSNIQFPSLELLLLYSAHYDSNDMDIKSIEKIKGPRIKMDWSGY